MKRKIASKIVSMMLAVIMTFTMLPTSALAGFMDSPLTGVTGSGWENIDTPPPTNSTGDTLTPEINNTPQDTSNNGVSGSDSDTIIIPPTPLTEDEGVLPDTATDENDTTTPPLQNHWLQQYQADMIALEQRSMMSRSATAVPEISYIRWGSGSSSDAIRFGNGAYINSPLPKIRIDGEYAFCGEWNGLDPTGSYEPVGEGSDNRIKQILANFDNSQKSSADYTAAQVAIWARVMGTSVASWGTSPGAASAGEIMNGDSDYSNLRYNYIEWSGGTQDLIAYNSEGDDPLGPEPPDYPEDEYRIEVDTDVITESEVRYKTTYEYSDGIGQITVRKQDEAGNSLDGALFDIVVEFSDGTSTTVENWEVDNGARLFTWTHPKDNHDPATVTVTEVVAPQHYLPDPTPKTAVVHPTYTRVTKTETWTVTITTENTTSTVIEIVSGDVVAESTSSSSAETAGTPQVHEFTDFVEGDRETTLTFENKRITGAVEVTKRDANTGVPLAGASIHLKGDDLGEAGEIDKVLVTDKNGIALFTDLPPGTYTITETAAPHGYNLNTEIQTAVVQSGQTVQKEIHNYKKDGLTIYKVDTDGNPLAGAVFELRRGSGEVLLSEVTDQNGIIHREYLTEGLYVIEEIQAPDGYLISDQPIKEIFIHEDDDNKQYSVTFVNERRPSIEIIKKDKSTGETLQGATFRIAWNDGAEYSDITTDEDGVARMDNLDIGWYSITELKAPNGYILDATPHQIMTEHGKTSTVEIFNERTIYSILNIQKIDSITREPLQGAVFKLYDELRLEIGTYTTGKTGEIHLPHLIEGTYYIQEVKSPTGYLLDTTVHRVELYEGKTITVEIENSPLGSLQIIKTDATTNKRLYGAEFLLYDAQTNNLLGEFKTDQNGVINLRKNLKEGEYYIKETKAPDGYVLDETIYTVTVSAGETTEFTLQNEPMRGQIQLTKLSGDDNPTTGHTEGDPLAGAVFEIYDQDGEGVDKITTNSAGIATSELPIGIYGIREVTAPEHYIKNDTMFYGEIKLHGDTVKFEVLNYSQPTPPDGKLPQTGY